jgi:hypothetical protein
MISDTHGCSVVDFNQMLKQMLIQADTFVLWNHSVNCVTDNIAS